MVQTNGTWPLQTNDIFTRKTSVSPNLGKKYETGTAPDISITRLVSCITKIKTVKYAHICIQNTFRSQSNYSVENQSFISIWFHRGFRKSVIYSDTQECI